MSAWFLDSELSTCFCMQYGDTPLHKAAKMGEVEAIKALIEQGADIRSTNKVSWYTT